MVPTVVIHWLDQTEGVRCGADLIESRLIPCTTDEKKFVTCPECRRLIRRDDAPADRKGQYGNDRPMKFPRRKK